MKKAARVVLIIVGTAAVLSGALWVYAHIPSPKFEPAAYEPIRPDYWPTDGFLTSSPEEQGMDSAKLVEMVSFHQENHAEGPMNSIDSITIVRNDYIVADIHLNPLYPKDSMHILHSSTKSIVSALIGIAIEQGHIESIDVPVIDVFKDRDIHGCFR